jgi:hypothetical protein
LVSAGLLEIRVGVMRHGTGIVHAKFGIMYDHAAPGQGDAVVFNGSGNESAAGLMANYEQLEVSTSWEDKERLANFEAEFGALWGDAHPDVHTVSLPEALRLKLIKLAPAEPPAQEPSNALARQKAAMVWKFIVEAPYLPNGAAACDATLMVDLWSHQRSVVEETSNAWPAGQMLCDEVGMGKTIEAIGVLRRLLAGRGVKRALLLAPAGLLKQWQAELREKGALVVPRLEGINTLVWPDDRQEKVDGLADALRQDILLVSRETARTENNVPILLAASPWDVVLLDEAHAARRAKQVETEFNSANLLLDLLRRLQLQRRARSILLLIASAQTGSFRRSVAFWVSADGATPVESMGHLRELVEAWDGNYPDPTAWKTAEQQAVQQAAGEVQQRAQASQDEEGRGLSRQLGAARLRLLRELGRYLVCVNSDSDDLSTTLHKQMGRDIAGAKRLKECFARLGGYPEWPEDLRRELAVLVAGITQGQRHARLAGAELEAALNDPRWMGAT